MVRSENKHFGGGMKRNENKIFGGKMERIDNITLRRWDRKKRK